MKREIKDSVILGLSLFSIIFLGYVFELEILSSMMLSHFIVANEPVASLAILTVPL